MSYAVCYAVDLLSVDFWSRVMLWSLSRNQELVPGYQGIPNVATIVQYTDTGVGTQILENGVSTTAIPLPPVLLNEGDSLTMTAQKVGQPFGLALVDLYMCGWFYPIQNDEDGVRGTLVDPQC